ncbi:MAG: D-alanyl-D-alanine carboxypeptidase, partial [Rhodobacterales bacterium]|nr:D-alanyl-D-alanine carboxypeptidase [Rhodobacterales bacterium]
TKSANDVATAVAEAMDRQERDFALRMTAKARALGMTRTTFRNASGLPNRSQLSTARDMATLARALLRDYPQYYHYFETDSFRFAGRTHPNHNKLLETYAGADGIKTGYIRASGFNLVASAKRGGHRLIGVVFGGRSPKSRNRQMARLLDRGFARIDPYLAAIVKMTPKRKPRWAGGAATSVVPSVVPSVAQAPAAPADATPASVAEVASGQPSGQGDGDWGVQVGAYTRQDQAYDMARRAVSLAAAYLDDGTIKVVPLTKGKRRPLYRSRVLGLSKKQAYRACRLLKSKRVGCMELRATREVAQAD